MVLNLLVMVLLGIVSVVGITQFGSLIKVIMTYWWLYVIGIGAWVFSIYMSYVREREKGLYEIIKTKMLLKGVKRR